MHIDSINYIGGGAHVDATFHFGGEATNTSCNQAHETREPCPATRRSACQSRPSISLKTGPQIQCDRVRNIGGAQGDMDFCLLHNQNIDSHVTNAKFTRTSRNNSRICNRSANIDNIQQDEREKNDERRQESLAEKTQRQAYVDELLFSRECDTCEDDFSAHRRPDNRAVSRIEKPSESRIVQAKRQLYLDEVRCVGEGAHIDAKFHLGRVEANPSPRSSVHRSSKQCGSTMEANREVQVDQVNDVAENQDDADFRVLPMRTADSVLRVLLPKSNSSDECWRSASQLRRSSSAQTSEPVQTDHARDGLASKMDVDLGGCFVDVDSSLRPDVLKSEFMDRSLQKDRCLLDNRDQAIQQLHLDEVHCIGEGAHIDARFHFKSSEVTPSRANQRQSSPTAKAQHIIANETDAGCRSDSKNTRWERSLSVPPERCIYLDEIRHIGGGAHVEAEFHLGSVGPLPENRHRSNSQNRSSNHLEAELHLGNHAKPCSSEPRTSVGPLPENRLRSNSQSRSSNCLETESHLGNHAKPCISEPRNSVGPLLENRHRSNSQNRSSNHLEEEYSLGNHAKSCSSEPRNSVGALPENLHGSGSQNRFSKHLEAELHLGNPAKPCSSEPRTSVGPLPENRQRSNSQNRFSKSRAVPPKRKFVIDEIIFDDGHRVEAKFHFEKIPVSNAMRTRQDPHLPNLLQVNKRCSPIPEQDRKEKTCIDAIRKRQDQQYPNLLEVQAQTYFNLATVGQDHKGNFDSRKTQQDQQYPSKSGTEANFDCRLVEQDDDKEKSQADDGNIDAMTTQHDQEYPSESETGANFDCPPDEQSDNKKKMQTDDGDIDAMKKQTGAGDNNAMRPQQSHLAASFDHPMDEQDEKEKMQPDVGDIGHHLNGGDCEEPNPEPRSNSAQSPRPVSPAMSSALETSADMSQNRRARCCFTQSDSDRYCGIRLDMSTSVAPLFSQDHVCAASHLEPAKAARLTHLLKRSGKLCNDMVQDFAVDATSIGSLVVEITDIFKDLVREFATHYETLLKSTSASPDHVEEKIARVMLAMLVDLVEMLDVVQPLVALPQCANIHTVVFAWPRSLLVVCIGMLNAKQLGFITESVASELRLHALFAISLALSITPLTGMDLPCDALRRQLGSNGHQELETISHAILSECEKAVEPSDEHTFAQLCLALEALRLAFGSIFCISQTIQRGRGSSKKPDKIDTESLVSLALGAFALRSKVDRSLPSVDATLDATASIALLLLSELSELLSAREVQERFVSTLSQYLIEEAISCRVARALDHLFDTSSASSRLQEFIACRCFGRRLRDTCASGGIPDLVVDSLERALKQACPARVEAHQYAVEKVETVALAKNIIFSISHRPPKKLKELLYPTKQQAQGQAQTSDGIEQQSPAQSKAHTSDGIEHQQSPAQEMESLLLDKSLPLSRTIKLVIKPVVSNKGANPFEVDVCLDEPTELVKAKIAALQPQFQAEGQTLICRGKILTDGVSLQDQGVVEGGFLVLTELNKISEGSHRSQFSFSLDPQS